MELKEKMENMDKEIKDLEKQLKSNIYNKLEFIKNFSNASIMSTKVIMPILVDLFSAFGGLEEYEYVCDDSKQKVKIIDSNGNVVFSCPYYCYNSDMVYFYHEKDIKDRYLDIDGFYKKREYWETKLLVLSGWGTSNVSSAISFIIEEFIENAIFNIMYKRPGDRYDCLREFAKEFLISKKELLEKIFVEIDQSVNDELNKKRDLRKEYLENLTN